MKKTVISLMLALAMVFSLVLVAAPAAEAAEPTHTGHDGWTDLVSYDGTALAAGNYFFSANVDGLANTIKIEAAGEYTICLNGKTVDAKQARQILHINHDDAVVNICDCAGNGKLCNGKAARGGNLYPQKGTLNIYGGTITGGTATERGGNICCANGNLNIYAGTITDGTDPLGASIYFNNAGKLGGEKSLTQLDNAVKSGKVTMDGAVLMPNVNDNTNWKAFKLYSDMGTAAAPVSMDIGAQLKAQITIDLNGYDLYASFANTQADTNHHVYVTDTTMGTYGVLTYVIANGSEAKITMKNIGSTAAKPVTTPNGNSYVATAFGNGYYFDNGFGTAPTPSTGGSTGTGNPQPPTSNPATGDSANLVVMGLGLVLGVAGMACLLPKKHG